MKGIFMKRNTLPHYFLSLALLLCMFSGLAGTALAGDIAEVNGYIVSYGDDCTYFAKEAELSTIYIDSDKVSTDEARNQASCEILAESEDLIAALATGVSNIPLGVTLLKCENIVAFDTAKYPLKKGEAYDFNGDLFRFTFADAAYANGRSADVVFTYSNLHLVVSANVSDKLLSLASGDVILSGYEPFNCLYGFHIDVNIQVLQDGQPVDGTFYFTAADIDVVRRPTGSFGRRLFDAADNDNYSEQLRLNSGFGNVYLPDAHGVDDIEANDTKGYKCDWISDANGWMHFNPTAPDKSNYDHGSFYSGLFTPVNNAEGLNLTVWCSGGQNMGAKTFLLSGTNPAGKPIHYRVTSSTKKGGSIHTTAAGNPNGNLSDGSEILGPGTVVAPSGKAITYKMTPKPNYDLKKVVVDGVVVKPDTVIAADGSIYYTYTIDVDMADREIAVSWVRIHTDDPVPTPVPYDPTPVPADLNGKDHFAYIIGYPDGNVHPEANITRAEVATIFFRLLQDDVREANFTRSNGFSDVSARQWLNNAVSTMAKMDIVRGYPDGTFRPNENITRAEFAAIAARFDSKAGAPAADFSDVSGHWASAEIAKAAANGWINGYPDGTFKPDQDITRAEAMALVNRVLNRDPKDPSDLLESMIKWPDNMDTRNWYYLDVQEATNSHEYERTTKASEKWTALEQPRDWASLEM